MDVRKKRIEVFQDTMAWIREEPRLTKAVEKSKSGTRLYRMDEAPGAPAVRKSKEADVRVTKCRTFEGP